MSETINFDSLKLYREVVKRLEESKIEYDRNVLMDSPELCREIIRLLDYCDKL